MKKRHEKIIKDKEIKIITETLNLGKECNEIDFNGTELFKRRENDKKSKISQKRNMLSFGTDIDNEDDKEVFEIKKMRKNPDANTSYLPDKDRDVN